MNRLTAFLAGTTVATALVLPLAAAPPTSVKGEIVDLECSLSKGAEGRGAAHAACAMGCAKDGNQMAILALDEVYLIDGDYTANKNAKLLDFVAKTVEAKGTISDKDGKKHINVAAMVVVK